MLALLISLLYRRWVQFCYVGMASLTWSKWVYRLFKCIYKRDVALCVLELVASIALNCHAHLAAETPILSVFGGVPSHLTHSNASFPSCVPMSPNTQTRHVKR